VFYLVCLCLSSVLLFALEIMNVDLNQYGHHWQMHLCFTICAAVAPPVFFNGFSLT
jgi:hypothetical protein